MNPLLRAQAMLKFENDKHSLDHEDRGLEIAVPLSVIIKVLPVSATASCLCTLHVAVSCLARWLL